MFLKAWFIIRYWIGWIIFFQVARLLFLFSNFALTKEAGAGNFFRSLLYGLRMDLSMASYISLPVCLFVLLSVFIKPARFAGIYKLYTAVILLLILLLVFADIGLFKDWGFRIDTSFLKYLANPREAWASMYHLPIFAILLAFIITYALLVTFSNRKLGKISWPLLLNNNKLADMLLILILTALFIVPLRGGFQLAPLNQSSVYFSDNNFSNQSAINAAWNFMHSLTHNADATKNSFVYLDMKEALLIRDSLFTAGNRTQNILRKRENNTPDILFIVWESFTEKATHVKRAGISVTPGFNALKAEGIYFSNIYASGDRTDKGIVSVLSGYPAQPTTSIVKTPLKASRLPMISKTMASHGYNTSFYYGGELEFANMKAYLLGGGFKTFTSKSDFKAADQNSKWGAHDGVVMKKVLEGLSREKEPFFSTWLTLSSHEPFEVPVKPVFEGKDEASLFLNSLHYTDAVIYDFIQQCKKEPWWANTLVVIVADHGHRQPATGKKIDDFKIPLLLLGGALKEGGIVKDRVGSQTDIVATVLKQLNLPAGDFSWSKNLLDSTTKPWAYFCFNNGFGFVEPGNYYIFDNVGKKAIEAASGNSTSVIRQGKAVQQMSFQDYLDK